MKWREIFKIEIGRRPLSPEELKQRAVRDFLKPYKGEENLRRILEVYERASRAEKGRSMLY